MADGSPPMLGEPAAVTDGPPARRARLTRIVDPVLRVAGGLVALAAGWVTATVELFLVPLRVPTWGDPVRLPVAVLLAVGGNLALVWYAGRVTGVRWGVLLPGLGWFAMVALALGSTTEGDRLLPPNDLVATLTIFTGTAVLVVGTVRSLTRPRHAE